MQLTLTAVTQRTIHLVLAAFLAVYPTGAWAVDCNENGRDDACDIDCGAPGGPCDLPGCGNSSDCNVNGVPDECDASDDCNTNGVPDECEVVGLFAGNRAAGEPASDPARIYRHVQGTEWLDTTPGPGSGWAAAAVMDLAWFQGRLYAGIQTEHGRGGASGYDFRLMGWHVLDADGRIEDGTDPSRLDDPAVIDVLTDALELTALAGPIATASASGLQAYVFTTAAALGGVFAASAEAGNITVATLRLNVSAPPGTPDAAATPAATAAYRVTLTDAYAIDGVNLRAPLRAGPALTITVTDR